MKTVIDSEIFRDYRNCFISTIDNIRDSGELAKFWLTFIDIATVLLNTIHATRSGNWDLLIESLRETIPFTFAYDRIHYAIYLTVMVAEMTNLEFTNPDIYPEFQKGHFSVQLNEDRKFSRTEPDKTIEMTLNKDTKSPGCTKGFSTNVNAINRWALNATYRAELRQCFYQLINFSNPTTKHKYFTQSHILKDKEAASSLKTVLTETFINPFLGNELVCISNGVLSSEKNEKLPPQY